MAKVVLPLMSGSVSGKFGGIIFSKNGRARAYRKPANPKTPKQELQRLIFEKLNQLWTGKEDGTDDQGNKYVNVPKVSDTLTAQYTLVPVNILTQTEKDNWAYYSNAKGKGTKFGRQMFIKENSALLRSNQDVKRTP